MHVPQEIRDAIDAGALFVVNHSGGKDSQAMMVKIRELVPAEQIVVVHAILAGVEWEGTEEHARYSAGELPFYTCSARKTFFDMVEHRRRFPSPSQRQCTSDLKRDPINTLVRRLAEERGAELVVQCLGLRAEESASRRRQATLKRDARMSKAERRTKAGRVFSRRREVLVWLPIHDMLVDEVFATIAAAGETPHWAYAAGMTRLSCCFCIMSSQADLKTAAGLNPALYAKYVETERRLDFTLSAGRKTLPEITGYHL